MVGGKIRGATEQSHRQYRIDYSLPGCTFTFVAILETEYWRWQHRLEQRLAPLLVYRIPCQP
ncbi:MAG: hypothetical protein AB1589_18245 [Cyanobacteriota bacterium]